MAKQKRKNRKKRKASKAVSTEVFTCKQQKLIDCYDGDIKKAAKIAGLSYGYARRLVTKSSILAAIRNRENTEDRPKRIATRQERQQFWSDAMDDESVDMKDRLRASELLGRSEADFTENIKHSGEINGIKVLPIFPGMTIEQWLQFVNQKKKRT